MMSRRMNKMWKYRQKKFRNHRRSEDKGESSGHKRFRKRSITCYKCKEPGHFKTECPKLQREKPKRIFDKKRGMMATWDDSESSEAESDSKDEHANLTFMATTTDESSSESETEEVFSYLPRNEW